LDSFVNELAKSIVNIETDILLNIVNCSQFVNCISSDLMMLHNKNQLALHFACFIYIYINVLGSSVCMPWWAVLFLRRRYVQRKKTIHFAVQLLIFCRLRLCLHDEKYRIKVSKFQTNNLAIVDGFRWNFWKISR